MLTYWTFTDLLAMRIAFIRRFKIELRSMNISKQEKFNWFKQICRDRRHDAIAGMFETKKYALNAFHSNWMNEVPNE